MTINTKNIQDLLAQVEKQIAEEEDLSPALKTSLELMVMVINLLAQKLGLDSTNSSIPPSADPNRKKKSKSQGDKKPGGQKGRKGINLKPVDKPDIIHQIPVDINTLPQGQYRAGGYERRQVFDIDISMIVTEYQAQIFNNEKGQHFVAPFPEGVSRPAQYGPGVKTNAVYMSLFQLTPYNRVQCEICLELYAP
ncbi:DUF6444 domain-containing protein [Desulfonatronovibrio magnus]|uniref:DUF6444 domain-containing protein n=1 Tax=Desulfonatronovibrio magnus TaxID=698827 RepID=UPI0006968C2A|nr:DUF6444 domain-containing protein [Desulfonatronovibrio magnus]